MTMLPAAFSLVVSLLVMASIWSWSIALKKWRAGKPLLPYERRAVPPWSLLDICIIFVMWGLLQYSVALLVFGGADPLQAAAGTNEVADAPDMTSANSYTLRLAIVVSGLANLWVCVLGGMLIVFRTGARWDRDLGITLRHAGRDIAYGVVAFVMMAPIIYSIQLILVQWHPSEHDLIKSFRTNPTIEFYLVCAFSAAIAAPIFEEFVCRVLLQGLFERIAVSTSLDEALFALRPAPGSREIIVEQFSGERHAETPGDSNPYLPPIAARLEDMDGSPDVEIEAAASLSWRQFALPILGSSLIFAALHWGNGLDPIPLFFLALGLGYLYQRTHRILPCLVVHFLVNALALVLLAMSLVAQ